VNDASPLRLEAGGSGHDVHHHEWRHGAAERGLQQTFGLIEHPVALAYDRRSVRRHRDPAAAPMLPYSMGFVARALLRRARAGSVDRELIRP
jgi:hypothetical protein